MTKKVNQQYDVCIHGAGIVGRTLALLLAKDGFRVALVDQTSQHSNNKKDVRAYALNVASKTLLETLRVWPEASQATPVLGMQVHGDASGAVNFHSGEQGAQALAWIVDVPALEFNLAQAIQFQPMVDTVGAIDDAKIQTQLTVICEGKHSVTRDKLAIEFEVTPYHQHAVAARLRTHLSHAGIAKQWFKNGEILAFLPLSQDSQTGSHEKIEQTAGNYVALVWSVNPMQAQSLLALDEAAFALAVSEASGGDLGELQLCSERVAWPLQLSNAKHWVGQHATLGAWVLAGDAAHTVHPLSGQGLNLGLGDVAELAKVLRQREAWRKLSDQKLLRRYERVRKWEFLTVSSVTDGLQQLFARPEPVAEMVRNWGMQGFQKSGMVKRWIAKRAMGL
ncbi:MAG TPA: FAD-dependent monooxygenase [Burkholderiaceae bacterium]|nr:FAD-dependent monooxygenase [Burkholderiaceae bacterium]